MANRDLNQLIMKATSLNVGQRRWLLEASALSEAIYDAVLGDPRELDSVQNAVRSAATRSECDLIVGASPVAERVVRDLNTRGGGEPSKVLLFELVRVTGATLDRGCRELKHLNVVPAVLVDLDPSSQPSEVLTVGAGEP